MINTRRNSNDEIVVLKKTKQNNTHMINTRRNSNDEIGCKQRIHFLSWILNSSLIKLNIFVEVPHSFPWTKFTSRFTHTRTREPTNPSHNTEPRGTYLYTSASLAVIVHTVRRMAGITGAERKKTTKKQQQHINKTMIVSHIRNSNDEIVVLKKTKQNNTHMINTRRNSNDEIGVLKNKRTTKTKRKSNKKRQNKKNKTNKKTTTKTYEQKRLDFEQLLNQIKYFRVSLRVFCRFTHTRTREPTNPSHNTEPRGTYLYTSASLAVIVHTVRRMAGITGAERKKTTKKQQQHINKTMIVSHIRNSNDEIGCKQRIHFLSWILNSSLIKLNIFVEVPHSFPWTKFTSRFTHTRTREPTNPSHNTEPRGTYLYTSASLAVIVFTQYDEWQE
eukprot:gene12389-8512_t